MCTPCHDHGFSLDNIDMQDRSAPTTKRRTVRRALLAAVLAGVLAGPASATPDARPRAALVLAAASMQEAMTDAADGWARRGHPRPQLSFAGSSALARQIAAGAPADLFVSADVEWMGDVARRGRIVSGTRAIVARNRLVVVGGKGAPGLTMRGPDLARRLSAGPLAMADPDTVPAGRYGRAALTRLGAWHAIEPHVVRAENVRAALAFVERGAAPYGIVYATDVMAAGAGVRMAGVFPAASHPSIVYPVARLKQGPAPAEAEGFRRFLLSPAGRAILMRRGFGAP